MGFGTIFVTVAMVIIIVASSFLFVTGALFSMESLSNALQEINERDNERFKTEIEIGEVSVIPSNPGPGSDITVSVNNTGSTKILNSDYKYTDVFVCYDTGAYRWIPYNASMAFSTDAGLLGMNEWTVVQITPDLINPRVFDPDEGIEIVIRVYPEITGSGAKQNWTKIVMPNGVSDATYF